MQNQPANAFSWSEKLMQTVQRSPQKAAMLGGLAVVLVVMWARMFGGAQGPGGAAAATPTVPIMNAATDLPAPGHTDHTTILLNWARQPIVPMHRNLFAIPFDYYVDEQAHSTNIGTDGFWGLLAKSLSLQADQQSQRQVMIDAVVNSARQLQLQSIMFGAMPTAMINGQILQAGNIIEGTGFRILRIEQQQVIIEKDAIPVTISMQ
jgi:hypothetical protein